MIKPLSHRSLDASPPLPPEVQEGGVNPMQTMMGSPETPAIPQAPQSVEMLRMALEMGAGMEKMLEQMAQLVPSFAPVASQMIPLLRQGLRNALQGGQSEVSGAAANPMMGMMQ